MPKWFRQYYQLTKPGIIYGNAITAAAGFLLASRGNFNPLLFLAMILGISFVIGSGCVFNNYIDRDIDEKMDRTKNRALAKGTIATFPAIIYGSVLGIIGLLILGIFTNLLTDGIGVFGFVFYVILYGISKRRSVYGTLVGSFSGAVPPVAGYCAVTNRFDMGALLLFIILVLWQMPHFYSIAIFRLSDYKKASIPVLPAVNGIPITKIHMLFYIAAFIIASSMLTFFGYTGYVYLAVVILAGLVWLGLCIQVFKAENDFKWARKMFRFSLIVITATSVAMSINVV